MNGKSEDFRFQFVMVDVIAPGFNIDFSYFLKGFQAFRSDVFLFCKIHVKPVKSGTEGRNGPFVISVNM